MPFENDPIRLVLGMAGGLAGSLFFLYGDWRKVIENIQECELELHRYLIEKATEEQRRQIVEGKLLDIGRTRAIRMRIIQSLAHIVFGTLTGGIIAWETSLSIVFTVLIPAAGEGGIRLMARLAQHGPPAGTTETDGSIEPKRVDTSLVAFYRRSYTP